MNFTFAWPCNVTNFLIIKPTRCTNFSKFILEWNSTCFGQFLCPKHVEFHFQNKFEKLVHLVGFIVRKRINEILRKSPSSGQNFYTPTGRSLRSNTICRPQYLVGNFVVSSRDYWTTEPSSTSFSSVSNFSCFYLLGYDTVHSEMLLNTRLQPVT
jgi:hypothetical protein